MLRFKTLLALFLILPLHFFAQNDDSVPVTLETPYNTIYVHLKYLQPESYQPNLAAKVLYGVEDSVRAELLAVQLKQILDGKGLFVDLSTLPRDPDYISDSTSLSQSYTLFPDELPEVYVEKIDGKWYYSPQTIGQIYRLHKEVYPLGANFFVNLMMNFGSIGQVKFLGLALWQYLGLILFIFAGWFVHVLLSRILNPLVVRLSSSKLYPSLIPKDITWKIARYLSVFVVLRLIYTFLPTLLLPVMASRYAVAIIRIFSTILIVLIGLRILDIILLYARRLSAKTESKLDEQLLPILKRMLQVVVVIGGIVHILQVLDVNTTALIAGISIGGLAVALAAQDTVKNLIGSAMIFTDQPFQIGDFVDLGSYMGTVVEVGFRSTRIRGIDSSIISIPNGTIANQSIRNLGLRVYRLFETNIGITYDTPPDLIEKFIYGLRQIIENHPKAIPGAYYVHFKSLGDFSLNIMFRTQLQVSTYDEELLVGEEILFAIVRLAERIGVRFAFPTSTVHIEEFPEKNATSPVYETEGEKVTDNIAAFLEEFRGKINSENKNIGGA